jgi:hypothetical protein
VTLNFDTRILELINYSSQMNYTISCLETNRKERKKPHDNTSTTQQTELNYKEIELMEIIEKEDEQREFDEKVHR